MANSGKIEREIEHLETERNKAISAETAQAERQRQAKKAAEETAQKAQTKAVQQRISVAERKRAEGIARDLAWPAKVRETCFVEAINPLFKSWGLCQPFLDELRQGGFCDQCQHGYQNEYWLQGFVHREKARQAF